MKDSKKCTISLHKLSPAQQQRVQKALAPERDTAVAFRFPAAYVEKWRRAATAEDVFFVEWVEAACNAKVKK